MRTGLVAASGCLRLPRSDQASTSRRDGREGDHPTTGQRHERKDPSIAHAYRFGHGGVEFSALASACGQHGCVTTASSRVPLSGRRLVLPTIAVAALALSACSPVYDGVTGIARDDDGRLVGLWRGCDEEPVGATLIRDSNTANSVHVGEWVAARPSPRASFSLGPSPVPEGWTTWQPGPADFRPGHDYTLIAWKKLNETNAAAVDFTAADLTELAEGEVLIESANGPGRTTVVSRDEFDGLACKTN